MDIYIELNIYMVGLNPFGVGLVVVWRVFVLNKYLKIKIWKREDAIKVRIVGFIQVSTINIGEGQITPLTRAMPKQGVSFIGVRYTGCPQIYTVHSVARQALLSIWQSKLI